MHDGGRRDVLDRVAGRLVDRCLLVVAAAERAVLEQLAELDRRRRVDRGQLDRPGRRVDADDVPGLTTSGPRPSRSIGSSAWEPTDETWAPGPIQAGSTTASVAWVHSATTAAPRTASSIDDTSTARAAPASLASAATTTAAGWDRLATRTSRHGRSVANARA